MSKVIILTGNNAITEALTDTLKERSTAVEQTALPGILTENPGATVVYSPRLQDGTTPDLDEGEHVCRACAASDPEHVILISSAAVYGASPHNTGRIPETQSSPRGHHNTIKNAWLQLETLAQQYVPDTVKVTILRPAIVLTPQGEDFFSRLFSGRLAFTLPFYDPSIQLLSPEDLANAVCCAVEKSDGGIFNVAPAGVIPFRTALRMAGVTRIPLRPVQNDAVEYIRHSWTITAEKIESELGAVPKQSSAEALGTFLGTASKTPDAAFDTFGLDTNYIESWSRRLYGFLHNTYWRIETRGVEHVPREGRAILVGMHRGFMPFDGAMLLYLIARKFGRYVRTLIHPTLVNMPLPFNFIKLGGINADQRNADYVLQREELLVWFPEGITGAFRYYRDAYKLGAFGRNEFVRAALRNQAPIIPFVTVGSVEIFPVIAKVNWRWWKRLSLWPCFPIAPPFPLLSFPLPSKWHTLFLEPIHVEKQYPPEAASDPDTVRKISREVKQQMQAAVDDMLKRRKSIWFGNILDGELPGKDHTTGAND